MKNIVSILIAFIMINLSNKLLSMDYKITYIQNISYDETSRVENKFKLNLKKLWDTLAPDTITIFLRSTGDFRINHSSKVYFMNEEQCFPRYYIYKNNSNFIYFFNEDNENFLTKRSCSNKDYKIKEILNVDTCVFINNTECSIFKVKTYGDLTELLITYYYAKNETKNNLELDSSLFNKFGFIRFNEYLKVCKYLPLRISFYNYLYLIENYDLKLIEETNCEDSFFIIPKMKKISTQFNTIQKFETYKIK